MELKSAVCCVIDFILVCSLVKITRQSDACQLGEVRLAGGNSYLEGRVEYCKNGAWGTVCDDHFDAMDAAVTCRQLGFSDSGAQVRPVAHFGEGQGDIILAELECTGEEAGLGHCLSRNQCGHFEDVGVVCAANSTMNNQGVSLYFKGNPMPNNSLVPLETLIGGDPLYCVTSKPSCCNSTSTGNWYPPASSSPLGFSQGSQSTLYQDRGDDQSVRLHASGSSTTSGLYRCVVPDKDEVVHTIYVGVYSANEGSISSAQISYDKETSTLTCTSTGGPATTVTWSKDGNPVQVDGQTLQQVQEVMDTSSATYQSRLTIVNKGSNLSGSYKCTVTNARGNISSGNVPVTVCEDGELRTRAPQSDTTLQLELCSQNTWIRIESFLRVESSEDAIQNFALKSTGSVIELNWENISPSISRFDVTCSDSSNTFTLHLTAGTQSASFIGLPASLKYECCVSAFFQRKLVNTASYFRRTCLNTQISRTLSQTSSDQVEATLTYSLIAVIIVLIVCVFGVALGCICVLISKKNYQKTYPRRNLVDVKTASSFLVDNPIYKTTGSVASLNSENGILANGNGHVKSMNRTDTSHSSVSQQPNGHARTDSTLALASNPKYGTVEHDNPQSQPQPRYVRVTSDSEPEYELLPEAHHHQQRSNSTKHGKTIGEGSERSDLDPIYSLPTALNRPPSHHGPKGDFRIPVYDCTTDVPVTAGKDGEYAKLNHKP